VYFVVFNGNNFNLIRDAIRVKEMSIFSIITVIGLVVASVSSACADQPVVANANKYNPWTLHINGFAYHFKRNGQNEENYGAGFSYGFTPIKSEITLLNNSRLSVEFDGYRDSYNKFGYSGGVVWQRPVFNTVDLGLRAGLVHEDNAAEKSGLYVIPYLLPFVESRFNFPVNLRATFVPPIGNITNGMMVFQFMVDFTKF
jgi:hypothetical protein